MLFSSCWWCSRFPHIYPTNLGEVWVCQSGGRHTLWNFGRVLLDVLRIRQGKFVDKNRQRFLEISLSNFIKISAQPQTLSNFEIRQSFRCTLPNSQNLIMPTHTHTHTIHSFNLKIKQSCWNVSLEKACIPVQEQVGMGGRLFWSFELRIYFVPSYFFSLFA